MRIYVQASFRDPERAYLQTEAPDDTFFWSQDLPEDQRLGAFLDAEICFGNASPAWLPQAHRLRWLHLASVGFDEYLDLDWQLLGRHIHMTHLKGFFAIPAAEAALTSILSLYRRIDELARLQTTHTWVGYGIRREIRTLWQKKVLILGPGAIGRHLAALLAAFQCEVSFFGRNPQHAQITTAEALDRALPHCDVLVNILPGTPETEGLLDRRRLSLLAAEAIFVNIGRGNAVDEPALIELLQAGKIGGCVADVSWQEPLPPEHPLWDCPRLLLTQHSAGGSMEEERRKAEGFIRNLNRYRAGETLEYPADIAKGY